MARRTRTAMQLAIAAAMLQAWPAGARADPDGGSAYIYVSKRFPERLYLIDGGNIIFESPVNTGIGAAPTPDGDFHVFASYPQQTMRGTDPVTGQRYDDPNVPYVMYFDGGRAIHGFSRSVYGYPQSLGCVELPVYKARRLYELLQGGLDTEVVVGYQRPRVLYSSAAEPGADGIWADGYFWGAGGWNPPTGIRMPPAGG